MPSFPSRHAWGTTCLEPQASDRILEIGIGAGHAGSHILPLLTAGTYVGIDRSAAAIARSRLTLASWLRSGVAALHQASVETFVHSAPFDRILAINVNAFWLEPATMLPKAMTLLSGTGALVLVFEPPSCTRWSRIRARLLTGLVAAGFEQIQVRSARLMGGDGLAIRAQPMTPIMKGSG